MGTKEIITLRQNKSLWRWLKWVLATSGILLVILIIAFILIVKPFNIPKQANVIIPVFSEPDCSREFSPKFNAGPYYEGPLFDSHFHLPMTVEGHTEGKAVFPTLGKDVTLQEMVCQFEKEKVKGVFVFYSPNFWLFDSEKDEIVFAKWADEIQSIKNGVPEWAHLFFNPGPINEKQTKSILDKNKDIFDGIGEMVYISGGSPRFFSKPDDKISQGILQIASDNKLIVMMHPDIGQKENFEIVLQKYPNVIFIIHGWSDTREVQNLIRKHPNLYFTLDAATLYPMRGLIDDTKEEFMEKFKTEFKSTLEEDGYWIELIETYYDRFMWGTDKSVDWHYSEEMSQLQEEFSRAFIGRLPLEVRENFAYKNAEALLTMGSANIESKKYIGEKSLDNLSESAKNCIKEKIGEKNWKQIYDGERRPTAEEEQVFSQCNL